MKEKKDFFRWDSFGDLMLLVGRSTFSPWSPLLWNVDIAMYQLIIRVILPWQCGASINASN
jgi:hypothetical protein